MLDREPVAVRLLHQITQVIPTPVWIALGILAALAVLLTVWAASTGRRARRLERQRRRLADDVGLLQAALLPTVPATLAGARLSTAYRPAEGPAAGGDFYDAFELKRGCVAVIVGDVSGHGREALGETTLLRFTLRAYLEAGLGPRQALQVAGDALDQQLGEHFATVVLAVHDPVAGTLTYAAAGHPAPIVIGSEHRPLAAASAPPIGWGARTGTRETVIAFGEGAQACFHTDGLVECRSGGELYGRERLARTLAELPTPSAARLIERVRGACDHVPDDMAVCLIQAAPGALAGAVTQTETLELELERLDAFARLLEQAGFGPGAVARWTARAEAALAGAAEHPLATVDVERRRVRIEPAPASALATS